MTKANRRRRLAVGAALALAAGVVAATVLLSERGRHASPAPPADRPADTLIPTPAPSGGAPSPPKLGLARTLPAARCDAAAGATVSEARVLEGTCAWRFADGLEAPRGIVVDGAGRVLVVERGAERITSLADEDGDRVVGPGERHAIASAPGLNHGLWITGDHLYASSASTVYRWPYRAGTTTPLTGRQVVVRGMPARGHSTRTLLVDTEGRLIVSIGSGSNVDHDSSRARLMRYDISKVPPEGLDWRRGEVLADGLRNEVGIAFDDQGRLWGVENGVDNLVRSDLGGDIHANNPAEELNLFDEPGRFYGYPYCWTEYRLPRGVGRGRGAQWAHPLFIGDGVHDDAWCRDRSNVVPPRLSMQAHAAPLDILFWPGGDLPDALVGDALVSFHGSWNRPEPTGYEVVRAVFDDRRPVRVDPVLQYGGSGATGEGWPHRPVGLAVGPAGELLVTSDRSGAILALATAK